MEFITQSNNLNDYLECSEVIDCNNLEIQGIASNLSQGAENEIELVKSTYEFVRDEIRHSSDAGKSNVTCKASDVLKYKLGLCFGNSHLLAAILRALDIPTGFCYQKLEFDVGFGLHGLNAVFIKSIHKWIRLDARGNEGPVNAQFSLDKEILAYPVDEEKGEVDFLTIYSEPNEKVIEILEGSRSLTEAVEKIISTDWLKIVI
ncbi:MAG: transglutaminase family protein [Methanobacterium sp.]|nr:transglutaminase family protein [Methanobacterium sp.]